VNFFFSHEAPLGAPEAHMSRKLRALLFCIIAAAAAVGSAKAQTTSRGEGNTLKLSLKQQLNAGLLARTPQEKAFNANVVKLVDDGTLPLSLVQSTFLWARNKQPYPMPYFERALRARAKKSGIKL
jgi:hypothetical protein